MMRAEKTHAATELFAWLIRGACELDEDELAAFNPEELRRRVLAAKSEIDERQSRIDAAVKELGKPCNWRGGGTIEFTERRIERVLAILTGERKDNGNG
jgi:hypothetical protein